MTVTCLVCSLPTYRVAQQVTPDLCTEEGPVLPTDDWVEKELCKSATGWIEVFQDSLVSSRFSLLQTPFRLASNVSPFGRPTSSMVLCCCNHQPVFAP